MCLNINCHGKYYRGLDGFSEGEYCRIVFKGKICGYKGKICGYKDKMFGYISLAVQKSLYCSANIRIIFKFYKYFK